MTTHFYIYQLFLCFPNNNLFGNITSLFPLKKRKCNFSHLDHSSCGHLSSEFWAVKHGGTFNSYNPVNRRSGWSRAETKRQAQVEASSETKPLSSGVLSTKAASHGMITWYRIILQLLVTMDHFPSFLTDWNVQFMTLIQPSGWSPKQVICVHWIRRVHSKGSETSDTVTNRYLLSFHG